MARTHAARCVAAATTDVSEFPFAATWGRTWLPSNHYTEELRNMKKQASVAHNGFEIHQKSYTGTFDKYESKGFTVDTVYVITDDFGDFTLPLNQQNFWSPSDAAQAIDCANHLQKTLGSLKKWPTSAAHEFNVMLCYRRKFWHVYDQIQEIRAACHEARDFGDDPTEKILGILNTLHQHVIAEG